MIDLTVSGAIATIRLDRAATRNALDRGAWRRLAEAVGDVGRSDARVLLLASAVDGAFCAGSDLRELAGLAENEAARPLFRALMREAIDALPRLDIPAIAAIDGDCFGAGVALALGCDLRIAGKGARFAVTPAKLGISYPEEDVARLVGAIGRGQASRLLFTAAPIDAEEAARIGLVERVAASALEEAAAMAELIAANAASSLTALKGMLQGRVAPGESDRSFDACFEGDPFRERLAAFRGRPRTGDGPAD